MAADRQTQLPQEIRIDELAIEQGRDSQSNQSGVNDDSGWEGQDQDSDANSSPGPRLPPVAPKATPDLITMRSVLFLISTALPGR